MFLKKEQMQNSAVKSYSKPQLAILGKSSLYAGLGFVLICLIGFGFFYALQAGNVSYSTFRSLGIIFSFLWLGSMIWFMFDRNFTKMKYGILYSIFIISQAISFVSLFSLFNGTELMLIFGVAGLAMVVTGLIGYFLPPKFANSLMKLLMISIVVSLIFSLLAVVGMIFGFRILDNGGSQWYIILATVLSSFICVGYNVFLFYSISKTSEFLQEGESNTLVCLYMGFLLLVSYVQLVWLIARLFLIFGKN